MYKKVSYIATYTLTVDVAMTSNSDIIVFEPSSSVNLDVNESRLEHFSGY